ncbi:MAG: deoxyribonuclease IV [Bacilli bacterium]
MIIGSHVGCSGKKMLLGSVEEALSYNSNTFMFYTGAPQNTRRKPVEEFMLEEALELMKENNINYSNVIVHAPYIINLANTTKPETFDIAVRFLKEEIDRCEKLGIKTIVLHPGSHVGAGIDIGIKKIIEGLNLVFTKDQTVKIALETMSGKGTECGYNFEQIRKIINGVELSHLLYVCLDTCHVSDAGYDLNDFESVLDEFDRHIGLDRLAVIHVNDSKNPKGSKKDRHANIGFGSIGFDALLSVIYHPKLKDIPKVLETPYIENELTKKRMYPPYKHEIEMIKNKSFNSNLISEVLNDATN